MTASSPMPSMLTDQLRQALREAQDQVNALVLGKVPVATLERILAVARR